MRHGKESARRRCDCDGHRDATSRFPRREETIVAQNDWERGTRWAGIGLGIAFGAMFAMQIIGG